MYEPIFLKPVFQERIWGGTKLHHLFGYDLPSECIGECWAVSAHPNGQSIIENGEYAGKTLGELWKTNIAWFGDSFTDNQPFPLLTKILDASADLSVQVHPDDPYAYQHENGELGKTECWYIIDAEPGSEIIYGHNAATREQLAQMIANDEWDRLLKRVQVKPGDFYYVPSGTIHALGKGIVVLETQQSSDTTYRVFDYHRTDASGKPRELHLKKAIDVTTVPHAASSFEKQVVQQQDAFITTFISNEFFTVKKIDITGSSAFEALPKFLICSVLSGEGKLCCDSSSYSIQKAQHFILPASYGPYTLEGNLELIISHP